MPSEWKVLTVSPLAFLPCQQGLPTRSRISLRRLVGEGDGGDVARRIAALLDQVSNLVGDDARLAAARPGEHQQRAIEIASPLRAALH